MRRGGRRDLALGAAGLALAAAGVVLALTLRGGGVPPASSAAPAGSTRAPVTAPRAAPAPPPPAAVEEALPDEAAQLAAVGRIASLGLPLFCAGHRGRYVALTFDDGPGAYTPLVLRILRRAGARATFFLVGRNLAAHGSLPRSERALGAVGDHTWTHPVLTALPAARMRAELRRTRDEIARLSGAPVSLFRPPYGRRSRAVDAEARRLGMLEVLWSVDSRDSEGADYRRITRIVLRGLRPGAIVLMHENRGQTIRALRFHILPALERLGLRAVSVPELLAVDPPSPAQLRRGFEGCR